MVGRPVDVSPSRTYVVVICDIVAPNEARFIKVELPESFPNNSKNAIYYYQSISKDHATRIFDCVTLEDYRSLTGEVIEEVMLEKPRTVAPKFAKRSQTIPKDISYEEDMKQVGDMLVTWYDNEEPIDNPSYTRILKTILDRLQLQTKVISEIKGAVNFIDNKTVCREDDE